MADPKTEEMQVEQTRRARQEKDAAERTEERAPARRAERAEYLAEKLAERARAEERRARA